MIPYVLVALGAAARLIPHPPNFTPIGAIALYGGAHLPKRLALIVPLGALFLSDALKGFYPGMAYVYPSFLLVGCLGLWLRSHPRFGALTGATVLGSTLFFLITLYGSWLSGEVPPILTFKADLIASLPFYRNMLAGDLMYVGIFFGLHRAAQAAALNRPDLRKLLFQGGH